MCSEDIDKREYQEIDAISDKYIIKLCRKISSADAILPHADEQYKYSEALLCRYQIYKNKTGELSICTVEKEVKKADDTGQNNLKQLCQKDLKISKIFKEYHTTQNTELK